MAMEVGIVLFAYLSWSRKLHMQRGRMVQADLGGQI